MVIFLKFITSRVAAWLGMLLLAGALVGGFMLHSARAEAAALKLEGAIEDNESLQESLDAVERERDIARDTLVAYQKRVQVSKERVRVETRVIRRSVRVAGDTYCLRDTNPAALDVLRRRSNSETVGPGDSQSAAGVAVE